jgi:hypothetical protein
VSQAVAVTVVVPTDELTIQAAVDAAGADGTVIINSNATFDETVRVTQSPTIHGGVGFHLTIRATDTAAPPRAQCSSSPQCRSADAGRDGRALHGEERPLCQHGGWGKLNVNLVSCQHDPQQLRHRGPGGTGYLAFNTAVCRARPV